MLAKLVVFVLLILTTFFNTVFAMNAEFKKKHSATMEAFCKVNEWGKLHTRDEIGYELYRTLKIANPIAAADAIGMQKKEGQLVIDARDDGARGTGVIPGTLLITSDYKSDKKNQFTEKELKRLFSKDKKVKKRAKKNKIIVNNIEDLSKIKWTLFCNGFKCHRSTWAACSLRKIGVPFENINIVLGGYTELMAAGAKNKPYTPK